MDPPSWACPSLSPLKYIYSPHPTILFLLENQMQLLEIANAPRGISTGYLKSQSNKKRVVSRNRERIRGDSGPGRCS